jgi:ppGpp synthetase/RelA/SpoT-type nucleotidyltranferase
MPLRSTSDDAVFDRSVAAFSLERGRFEKMASYVSGLISDHCGGGLIHTTEHRAKMVDSFDKKCRKLNSDDTLRYPRPLENITDLAGVRVIVFLRDSVDVVCNEIGKIFEIVEQEDVGERVYLKGKFGYQSKHLIIRLGDDRKGLVENKSLQNLVCEIQVRTLLQHAWAEMEHDIQYKGEIDIPLDLNKRFSALAGLLEIADREFASIQRDSEALKIAVKDDAITDLTQQNLNVNQDGKSEISEERLALDARDLIGQGRYLDAIDYFTLKIKAEPRSYTLLIGRARAHFLAGDVRSAITDLDSADQISGDVHFTTRLRGIIEGGDDPRKAVLPQQTSAQISADRFSASRSTREGDGVRAFEDYCKLEEAGYNRAYSLFGKAMACALERDTQGARNFLRSLELRPGTPMAVNICALSCILDIIDRADPVPGLDRLQVMIQEAPYYDLGISLFGDLRSGFQIKAFFDQDRIGAIFLRLAELAKEPAPQD